MRNSKWKAFQVLCTSHRATKKLGQMKPESKAISRYASDSLSDSELIAFLLSIT